MNRGGRSCSFMLLQKKIKFLLLGARKTDCDFFCQNVFSLVVKWTFKEQMFWKDLALQKRSYSSKFEERFHFSKYLVSKKFRFRYGLVFLFLMICYILINFSQRRSHIDGENSHPSSLSPL